MKIKFKYIFSILVVVFPLTIIACNTPSTPYNKENSNNSNGSKEESEKPEKGNKPKISKKCLWNYKPGYSTATSSMQAYWTIKAEDEDGDLKTICIDGKITNISGYYYSTTVYGKTCYGTGPKSSNYYDIIREVVVSDSKGNYTKVLLTY